MTLVSLRRAAGTPIPEGDCDCAGHVADLCGVCGGSGVPPGFCDCHGSKLDVCGDCGGPGFVADDEAWRDSYGDGCARYRERPEFCGFEDSLEHCQTACTVCPAIMAVHTGQLSSLNHANIHIGGSEELTRHYGDCVEAKDAWGFRCDDYRQLGFSCHDLIVFYGYDCRCSCYAERQQMAAAGELPAWYHGQMAKAKRTQEGSKSKISTKRKGTK